MKSCSKTGSASSRADPGPKSTRCFTALSTAGVGPPLCSETWGAGPDTRLVCPAPCSPLTRTAVSGGGLSLRPAGWPQTNRTPSLGWKPPPWKREHEPRSTGVLGGGDKSQIHPRPGGMTAFAGLAIRSLGSGRTPASPHGDGWSGDGPCRPQTRSGCVGTKLSPTVRAAQARRGRKEEEGELEEAVGWGSSLWGRRTRRTR